MSDVSLEMIQSLVQRSLEEQGALRKDVADLRSVVLGLVEQVRRLDRRVGEVDRRVLEARDDIELMVKAELMGRLGNFETRMEAYIDSRMEQPHTPGS